MRKPKERIKLETKRVYLAQYGGTEMTRLLVNMRLFKTSMQNMQVLLGVL